MRKMCIRDSIRPRCAYLTARLVIWSILLPARMEDLHSSSCGDSSHTAFGYQLHADFGFRIDVLQVEVGQLCMATESPRCLSMLPGFPTLIERSLARGAPASSIAWRIADTSSLSTSSA